MADVGQLVRAGDVVPKRQFFPVGVPVHRDTLVNLEIKYKFLKSESGGIEIVHLFNAKYWNVPLQLNQLKKKPVPSSSSKIISFCGNNIVFKSQK